MAAITVSLLHPVVLTSRVAQADQIAKKFLLTSQQFLELDPSSADRKEISIYLRTPFAYRGTLTNLDSEWIDPVRFRVSGTSLVAPSCSDANLASAPSNVSRGVSHG